MKSARYSYADCLLRVESCLSWHLLYFQHSMLQGLIERASLVKSSRSCAPVGSCVNLFSFLLRNLTNAPSMSTLPGETRSLHGI